MKDKIKKTIKNPIFTFIIGLVIAGTVVGAGVYQYQASDIKYGSTNVSAAINDLYGSVSAQENTFYGSKIDTLLYNSSASCSSSSTACSYTCPSGKTCVAFTSIPVINDVAVIYTGGVSGTSTPNASYICSGNDCSDFHLDKPIYLTSEERIYVKASKNPKLLVFSLR